MSTKKIFAVLFVFALVLTTYCPVIAEQKKKNIIFVMDCSNSMNFNDKEKISNEIIKMFADSCFDDMKIGLVLYNDSILQQYQPTTAEKRDEIKFLVDNSTRLGSTDIGLGLKTAVDMFPKGESAYIILFSDGETDLSKSRVGRTKSDSYNDEQYAINKAKEMNCPIYTVGLSRGGKLSTDYLNKISDSTNAKTYILQSAFDMPEIFSQLYENIVGIKVEPLTKLTGQGNEEVALLFPGAFSNESHILINYRKNIDGTVVDNSNGDVSYQKSKNYTAINISNQTNDKSFLRFISEPNDTITVSIIHNISIFPQIEQPANNALLNMPINIKLYNKDTNKEADRKVYEGMTGELTVTQPKTGQKEKIALGNTGTLLTATYKNNSPGEYVFQAEVSSGGYHQLTPETTLTLSNTPPNLIKENGIPILKGDKPVEIDLNDYYKDEDGDILTYQLEDGLSTEVTIDKNLLYFTPKKEGDKNITLFVSDGRGGVITSTFLINVQPFASYYKTVFITIAGIFIVLIGLYYACMKAKRKRLILLSEEVQAEGNIFQGARFEGYFLKTLSGNEIPVLYWNASYMNNKHSITLGELFRILDVEEKLPEGRRIYFQAGKNNTVIFYHDTNCIINLGARNIPAGKKEILNFDDRLYIVFEDNVTEIEIRYKRTRGKIQKN